LSIKHHIQVYECKYNLNTAGVIIQINALLISYVHLYIHLYALLIQISTNAICLTLDVYRTGMVAKSQPVAVRVYDYYQPSKSRHVFARTY